ncbi:cell envelope-related function transcriptional attenuator common domain-containing protein [Actinopolymorpha cephalotaxi]|uniref:Cell envelope-related function transcriptional attenuator common domain-containing protein n=1 Tax=Actinopolymorpha cephalotaxi TaxID=504797 RepID=A0A1I2KU10_9ACTN|nr:LCP family protein [Actinopolymorpha cephalotaxi]NYH84556.1 LCP family protein required for cell wall assembly [Actinopolymorpha cephalotaxi]SFF68406.1 cell envelope-related function transcriptional attenuator common domain-containing protein [Actinopolymorpha cephalotaxi]
MPDGGRPQRPGPPDDEGRDSAHYGWLYEGAGRERSARENRSRARRGEAPSPEPTQPMPTRSGPDRGRGQRPQNPPPRAQRGGGRGEYAAYSGSGNDYGEGRGSDRGGDYGNDYRNEYADPRDDRDRPGAREYGGRPRGGGRAAPPPRGPGGRLLPEPKQRRRRSGFRLRRILLLLLVAWLVILIGVPILAWSRVTKVPYEPAGERPASGSGTNFLLVGSDSRQGLTAEQRNALGTGRAAGQRTDTIMILHVPSLAGSPTLVSLPRDSYVPVPGHGRNKINAAFSIGGPKLLTETVESATGLKMDSYVEIGFGGFVGVVEGLGGVTMCLPKSIKDEKAHIDLPSGCQNLNGPNALGYVRARYFDPKGDLGRVERQRQFLSAVVKKTASPGTLVNPVRYTRVGLSAGDALTVGEGTTVVDMARFGLAMRSLSSGSGTTLTVPVSSTSVSTPVGSAVRWDRQRALNLFHALRDGGPIPPSLIPND